ncbi:MAG TPA: M14 family zinc carboxypeptidase [Baekduia sp.]|nr:M14 family zinc carboxypeptidase [Baekduia sp.]
MRSTPRAVLLACALGAALPATAAAAPADVTIPAAARQDCTARILGARPGVWSERIVAPGTGSLTLTLRGSTRDDWDLALFDAVDGARVASSAGFGAREVVQATMREGAQVVVQACRRSGRDRTIALHRGWVALDDAALRPARAVPSLVRVALRGRDAVARLEALGLDVTHDVRRGSAAVLLHSDADRQALARTGLASVPVVGDLAAHAFRARSQDRARARAAQAGSVLPTGRTTYRTYEDYQRELKELTEAHPGLVRPRAIRTRTFQGRELQAVEIAQDVGRRDDGRPVFLLNAMHHAREWPGPEGVMEFAHDLVGGFGKDPRISRILRDVRVVVMPLTNADGFIVSRNAPDIDPDAQTDVGALYQTATGVVLLGGSLSYKRKNCNPVGVTTSVPTLLPCEFSIGVDNNRNYAASWGGPGASTNPNDQTFRGSAPFSEPETRAFRELFSQLNATMMITTHNVAALVLRPPGLRSQGLAPDEPQLKQLGDAMAAAAGYTSQYGWELYDTTGTTDDWSYSASGGFGYTVEMGPADGVFHGSYQRHVVDQYRGAGNVSGKGLREAYLLAAEAARNPAWTSRIAGRAPAGRTLRIVKEFRTPTAPVCGNTEPLPGRVLEDGAPTDCVAPGATLQVPERFEMTTVVPASGEFEWWVNPSTRPFVAKAGGTEVWKLTCEQDGAVRQAADVLVARGETAQLELPCGGTLPAKAARKPTRGLRVSFGTVRPARERARIPLRLRGGSLRSVRLRILERRGNRVLGEARAARVTGSRVLVVRLRRAARLVAGRTYRLVLTARRDKGSTVRVTRAVRVRR